MERDAATDAARKSEEANRKLRIEADNKSAGFSASNPYRAPAPMANRDRRNKYGTQLNADGTLPAESAEAYDDVASTQDYCLCPLLMLRPEHAILRRSVHSCFPFPARTLLAPARSLRA